MVFDPNVLTQNAADDSLMSPNKRIISDGDINVSIDSTDAATLLDVGYPMGFNKTTNMWGPWMAPDPTVLEIFLGTTPATGGTWGITVNSNAVEVDIAFDATADEVVAALRGMGYTVTCTLASDTYTITFGDTPELETLPTVVGTVADLTGDTASSATTTAGTATSGKHIVRGFVNPEVVQTGINTGTAALVVLTATDTVCTGTLVNHGLRVGMSITVTGASETKLNITATITAVTSDTFTYTVAAVTGGTVDSGVFTTTNDIQAMVMVKGKINRNVPSELVATADVTALDTAMKAGLIADGLIVQGLSNKY